MSANPAGGAVAALRGRAVDLLGHRGERIVTTGLIGGAVAGMAMAMWMMGIAAAATTQTAVPGIVSSVWTPVTAITSFIFDVDAFHGSFDDGVLSILFGITAHMGMSMMLGVLGVALITAVQGMRPTVVGAVMQGAFFGVVLEVVILNLIVNNIQDVNTVYTSAPEWSWWIGHGIFGMMLGGVAALLLRREPRPVGRERPEVPAEEVGAPA